MWYMSKVLAFASCPITVALFVAVLSCLLLTNRQRQYSNNLSGEYLWCCRAMKDTLKTYFASVSRSGVFRISCLVSPILSSFLPAQHCMARNSPRCLLQHLCLCLYTRYLIKVIPAGVLSLQSWRTFLYIPLSRHLPQ